MKLFHFKVLELKQVQHPPKTKVVEPNLFESCMYKKEEKKDLLNEERPASDCIVKYHFFHRLLSRYRILDRDEEGKKKE